MHIWPWIGTTIFCLQIGFLLLFRWVNSNVFGLSILVAIDVCQTQDSTDSNGQGRLYTKGYKALIWSKLIFDRIWWSAMPSKHWNTKKVNNILIMPLTNPVVLDLWGPPPGEGGGGAKCCYGGRNIFRRKKKKFCKFQRFELLQFHY